MKSFSNNIPDATKVVTCDELSHELNNIEDHWERELSSIETSWVNVQNNNRSWMFGLAIFNIIVTIILFIIALHH